MDVYRRRVSVEEAREGYLLVEKRALAFFPPVGERFELDGRDVAVRAVPCECRGPDRPHEHYRIEGLRLERGREVAVTQTSQSAYSISS